MGRRSMNEALEAWRNLHGIDEEAYQQLRVLLFEQSPEITNFVGSGYVNLPLTLPGTNIFSPVIFETAMQDGRSSNVNLSLGMPDRGFSDIGLGPDLFETTMPNGGLSNTGLGPDLFEVTMSNGVFSDTDFSPDIGTVMPNVGFWGVDYPLAPLESFLPDRGFSNKHHSGRHSDGLGSSHRELDSADIGNHEGLNESLGDAYVLTSKIELNNTTTGTLQRGVFATQQIERPTTPRLTSCTRCWKWKKKIAKSQEGNDAIYQSKLAWEHLNWTSTEITALLCHERGGPTIEVRCRQFQAVSPEQTRLYYRHGSGWKWIESSKFALASRKIEGLDDYISSCTRFCLAKLVGEGSWLSQIFAEAQCHMDVSVVSDDSIVTLSLSFQDPLMWLALRLWAANHLLMKGWQIVGHETLGMPMVMEENSNLFCTIPAPRVLQNQLDRDLESYIARTEPNFLKALQKAMLKTQPQKWIVVFTAVVITLHMRERDIWRLEYWVLNPEVVSLPSCNPNFFLTSTKSYKWRHPETASTLIQRSVHSSNLLLNHLHFSGDVSRAFFDIEKRVKTQERASLRYRWTDESSIDWSLCSFAFDTTENKHVSLAKEEHFGC